MSGPIVPPLEVSDEADGGSVSGRPITTIEVTDGTLTVSGRTATIDTSGSGGVPGGSDTEVQFNNAGAFGGDSGFTYNRTTNVATVTGGVVLADMNIGDTGPTAIRATTINNNLYFAPEGSGSLILQNNDTGGGTLGDAKFIVMRNANTDEAIFKFQDATTSESVTLTQVSGSDFEIQNREDDKYIKQIVSGTGTVIVENSSVDTDSQLTVVADGTGTPIFKLENDTMAVEINCSANKKLTINGGVGQTFILDVSSASGGITFPDSTTLISAEGTAILATGVTDDYVLTADGAGAAAWEAAGGGDSFPLGPDPADVGDGTGYQFTATQAAWGGIDSDQGWVAGYPMIHPFIAQASGDLASISVHVRTAGAGTSGQFGIYTDNGGVPESLMGSATIDLSSTGDVTQTSLSATITTVRGTNYWVAQTRSAGAGNAYIESIQFEEHEYNAAASLSVGADFLTHADSNAIIRTDYSTITSLPATIDMADYTTKGKPRPNIGLKW